MERHVRISISIPMTGRASEVIAKALKVEANSLSSKRVTVNVGTSGCALKLEVNASDLTAARASINSFLRWIDSALQVYKLTSGGD